MATNINAKNRRKKARFLMIPSAVLESEAYARLSPAAVKLLVDIGAQFNGKNNGNLAATFSMLKPRGWRSTATLNRAKQELVDAGLIELTRQGGLSQGCRVPCLYALTWHPINECKGANGRHRLDVPPSNTASGRWKS